jgi:hypothetical protein
MRRRQVFAAMRAPILDIPPDAQIEAAKKIASDTCEKCGKTGLKNVGAHRRFCKG